MRLIPRRGMRRPGLTRALAAYFAATMSTGRRRGPLPLSGEERSRLLRILRASGHPRVPSVENEAALALSSGTDSSSVTSSASSPPLGSPRLSDVREDVHVKGLGEAGGPVALVRSVGVGGSAARGTAARGVPQPGVVRSARKEASLSLTYARSGPPPRPVGERVPPPTPKARQLSRETADKEEIRRAMEKRKDPIDDLDRIQVEATMRRIRRYLQLDPVPTLPTVATVSPAPGYAHVASPPTDATVSPRSTSRASATATSSVAQDSPVREETPPPTLIQTPIPSLMSLKIPAPPGLKPQFGSRYTVPSHPGTHQAAAPARPKQTIYCWNCGGTEHRWVRCPEPLQVFCRRCGYWGVDGSRCPDCKARRQEEREKERHERPQ